MGVLATVLRSLLAASIGGEELSWFLGPVAYCLSLL